MATYYSRSTGGFYLPDLHGETIPMDAIEITDALYDSLLTAQTEGKLIQPDTNGNPVAVMPAIPLSTLQANSCSQIDAAAGQARARYITVAPGQDAVYQLKYDEATAYQATTSPTAANFPHLNAEATETNTPIATVAANVISTRNAWVQVSAKIEGYRLGGKAAVTAATDAPAVQTALNTALANLEAC